MDFFNILRWEYVHMSGRGRGDRQMEGKYRVEGARGSFTVYSGKRWAGSKKALQWKPIGSLNVSFV